MNFYFGKRAFSAHFCIMIICIMINRRSIYEKQYINGLKSGLPIIFGYIPVSIAYAIMARQAGLGVFETVFMSFAVYAGASQMMAAMMFAQGAGAAGIIFTTFVLNFRHLIMSTYVVNRLRKSSRFLKLLAVFGVTDETFAVFSASDKKNNSVYFFLGLVTATYLSWVFGSFIGAIISDVLPQIIAKSLGITLYAMFIALLVPKIKGSLKLILLVLLTAIVNTLLSLIMSSGNALIISALLCAAAGVFFVDTEEDDERI